MGRRPRFTRTEVEDAALAVLDREGVGGLTMRAVADVLGTGPMTLYTYVDDRAELDALVVDAVLRQVELPPAPTDDWRADVLTVAESVWRSVRPHPHAIPLILARRSHSATFLDIAEAILDGLARAGLNGAELLAAFRAVTTLATSFAMTELGGALATRKEQPAEAIDRFRSLPPDRHPRLIEIARAATTSSPDTEFRQGMTALLNGLARGPSTGAS